MELREEVAKALRAEFMKTARSPRPWEDTLSIFKSQWLRMADIAIELVDRYEQISSSS